VVSVTFVVSHRYPLDHAAFFENGTVHRDISIGNLLIVHREDVGETQGHLIDLDHAKHTDAKARIKQYSPKTQCRRQKRYSLLLVLTEASFPRPQRLLA